MERQIFEGDWKRWRELSRKALERYCRETLEGAAKFASGDGNAHARYLELFRYIRERDKEIDRIFSDHRRSNAYLKIAMAVTAGVVSHEELGGFSEETQAVIHMFIDP